MILLKANGQDLTVEQMERVASDFINVCTVHWSFDSRWDGMVKTAQYTQIDKETKERTTYSVLVDDATGCAILPNEIKAGELYISAFGVDAGSNQRITTVPVKVMVERSGFVGDGETPIPPSPDLYDQLINRVAAIQGTVESVNGYQGVILLTAEDVNARPDTWTPTAAEVGAIPADQGADNAGKALVIDADGHVIPGEVTGGGAVESVNGKVGAVTLEAADVGARPATWTPTAEEVGAAEANHAHTAQEVGAIPADQGADNAGKALVIDADGHVIPGEVTGGGAVESVNGKVGAVTLEAADVGARPATWTPTAEEVGAAEANHAHTAQEVGARPAAWMPTAQEVGARPDTWTPTAADVGARPDTWTPTAADVGAAKADHTHTANSIDGLADALIQSGQAVRLWPPSGTQASAGKDATISVPGMPNYNIIIAATTFGSGIAFPTMTVGEGTYITCGGYNLDPNSGEVRAVAVRFQYYAAGVKVQRCVMQRANGNITEQDCSAIYGMLRKG